MENEYENFYRNFCLISSIIWSTKHLSGGEEFGPQTPQVWGLKSQGPQTTDTLWNCAADENF